MKLWLPCSHCVDAATAPLIAGPATLKDSGLAIVDCPKGHQSAVMFDERKYWVLLMSACNAYCDGHFRESVSSMAAAIERAYEFYVRCSMHSKGLSLDQVEEFWKPLSHMSERQFGAFCALYYLDTKSRFEMPGKQIEFRNRVIHQGYLPSEAELLEYGRFAFNVLRSLTKTVDGFGRQFVRSVQDLYLAKQKSEIPDGMPYLTFNGFQVRVDQENNATPVESFEEFVVSFVNGQNWMEGWAPPKGGSQDTASA
ncbi:hypothetical protein [Mesorhizobium sp. M1D.F.Ca.ET.043.01.1.1]|uniref:hypothetical protein n=1 Tax=Mesorhizobium sp. M1D.F.Ca.ET.043.01.1.1 TaxID=2493669 RepID=UPI000F763459|nr:hypothetical protein [Mesorhizobium sp. M1D.F.Ca.ET.043.01.1.1]AZO69956.1 hypothetical protein EJ067_01220 [Mesorhizobium sp. M1D.F.Ca.ET.043.01.1.1]